MKQAGIKRGGRAALLVLCVAALCGCAHAPSDDDWSPAVPRYSRPIVANGAIYQEGQAVPLFENVVARHIGDVLTVRIEEKTEASKSASRPADKVVAAAGTAGAAKPDAKTGKTGADASHAGADGTRLPDGQGESKQSDQLTGYVTVSVIARFENGDLLVRGQKWLMINRGREFVRVRGIVRPADISPDNVVPSYRLADAVIAYGPESSNPQNKSLMARLLRATFGPAVTRYEQYERGN